MEESLINDGVPMWMALNGKLAITREAENDKEFYAFLKKKILQDIERAYDKNDLDKKANAVIDASIDIQELLNYVEKEFRKRGMDFHEHVEKRTHRTGLFEKKLILIGEESGGIIKDAESKRKVIENYGETNEYPAMVLKRDSDNKPYKILGSGKEIWINAMAMESGNKVLQENFNDLFEAVIRNDRKDQEK